MGEFTNEQIEIATKYFKQLGILEEQFIADGKFQDLFAFLKFSPEVDSAGNRKLTPYEVLGVMPNIKNGKEYPIIFCIKNKKKNLKPAKVNSDSNFTYKKRQKEENDKAMIDFMVSSYKNAITQNNLAEADRCFEMLEKLTGGRAERFIGTYFNYTKFYRQMKKQLLIDMFSHFFLMYLLAKKSIIKKGLVIKNIRFKKYIQQKSSELESIKEILPTIKSIKIDEVSNEFNGEANLNGSNLSNDFDSALNSFEKNNPVNKPAIADNVTKTNTIRPQPKKSFVKKFIKKLFRKKQANELDQAEKINEIDESLKKEVSYE